MTLLRRPALLLSLSAGALVGATAGGARGDPSAQELSVARDIFAQAVRDEDAGRWDDALEKLRAVARVRLTAGVRYHVALCEEHMGRLANALDDFTLALDEAGVEKAQDVLRLVGTELADLSPRVPRITVRLVPDTPGATVQVDAEPVARARVGKPIALNPGAHKIEALAPGRRAAVAIVTMRERDATSLELQMPEAVLEAPPPPPAPPIDRNLATREANARVWRSPTRVVALATAVGSVGLAAFGVASYVWAGNARDAGHQGCSLDTSQAACDARRGPVRAWDWVALGAWGGAAIAASATVYLWTRPPRPRASATATRLVVSPVSAAVAGTF